MDSKSATSAYQIAGLLEKMSSQDKDFRYMATNDLKTELQRNTMKLDEDSEKKVVRSLVRLLEDKNAEVQNLAVECLGVITQRLRDNQAECMVDALCANMASAKEELRDVSSVALKKVIGELPPSGVSFTAGIVRRLVPKMNEALATPKQGDTAVRLEMLEMVGQLLLRHGSLLHAHYQTTQEVLLSQLSSDRQAVRKRATAALGQLAAVCNAELFHATVEHVRECLSASRQSSSIRTYVQALTAMARSSGGRFAQHLGEVVPLLFKFTDSSDDDELKEAVIQCLEVLATRCPRELTPYVPQLEQRMAAFLQHDPNYTYDDDEENGAGGGEGMETSDGEASDGEASEEEEDYSDDDDMSWKVRRAAAKAIEALIVSRREQLAQSAASLGPILISRLKEREENVRSDVFCATAALLKQTRMVAPMGTAVWKEGDGDAVTVGEARFAAAAFSTEQLAVVQAVAGVCPQLVRALTRLLRLKAPKTRQLCFGLLSEMCKAVPACLSSSIGQLQPGVAAALGDKASTSQMKMEALQFVSDALSTHSALVFCPHLQQLVPLVAGAVHDGFYKVSSCALAVSTQLIAVLHSCGASALLPQLWDAVTEKLKATDIDQEVKEKAIACCGKLMATFADQLGEEKMNACLPVLVDRVRNEMTRQAAVRALTVIVASELKLSIGSVLGPLLPVLADFMRKNERALKIATLNLVEELVRHYEHPGLDSDGLATVLSELPGVIRESDLQISQLALRTVAISLARFPSRVSPSLPSLLTALIQLSQSALLTGPTLQAALDMLTALVNADVAGKPRFEELLDQLTAPVYDQPSLSRQSHHVIAAETAVVAAASGEMDKASALVTKLAEQLVNRSSTDAIRLFSVLALGEMGRRCPAVYEKSSVRPEQLIVDAFNSVLEEHKTAAAYSLGGLAVGNRARYLPFILAQISAQPKRQYLLLHALKEVIASESGDAAGDGAFVERLEEVWAVLVVHADCAEEGTRSVVAECIGKLAQIQPAVLLAKLQEHVSSPSANMRAAVVTAVKYMVSDERRPIDEHLMRAMPAFLKTVSDPELSVRRVALVALNNAAHNKPALIRDLLDSLLPAVYGETDVRQELVREVEMGPFKHQVDDGLDLRKAAFECMYTLLESCLERLDVHEFITHMEKGLKDQHDIKLLTYLMLSKLAGMCPQQVLGRCEKICEPLKAQLLAKMKANAVKQECEKTEEIKRAAIRTVLALNRMPEADRQQQLVELNATIKGTGELATLLQQVERDAQRTYAGTDVNMDVV